MVLKFTKMHGLGNDYVLVGLFDQQINDPAGLARAMSDRHLGVGADGLILAAPPEHPDAHVRMIIFNADGSRAQMCGNGIRCLAKLVYERGWARSNPLVVQSDRGMHTVELSLDDDQRVKVVRVDLGPPELNPRRIPVALDGEQVVERPFKLGTRRLTMTCVSLGNPHAVFFVPDLRGVPLSDWGPRIEHHELFPERINAHFAQVVRRSLIRMISWERGAGSTRACGTGAAAVCVAGVLSGQTERVVSIDLPGGRLKLEWDKRSNHIFMTGPATEVFTGQWPL